MKVHKKITMANINRFIIVIILLICVGCVDKNNKVQILTLDDTELREYKIEYHKDSILIFSRDGKDKSFQMEWNLYQKDGEYRRKFVQQNIGVRDVLFMSNKKQHGYDTILTHTPFPVAVWPMEIEINRDTNEKFSTSVYFLVQRDDGQRPYRNRILKIIYDKNYIIKEIQEPIYQVKYITKFD